MKWNELIQNKWAWSVLAGILLGLSFPPINLSFLSFPAFVLLFHLSYSCDSYKQVAYYSYAGFVVWNLIGTYWLMMASSAAGIAAVLANSVLMTIPLALGYYFSRKSQSPYLIALLQTAAWVSYEFLHHHWDLSWTWLAIGNAWADYTGIIQYISVTGHLGITFWVIMSASLAYQALRLKRSDLFYAMSAVLLLFPMWSFILYEAAEEPADHSSINVAIIQPNHDSYQEYGGMSGLGEVVDSLLSITSRTIQEDTELIIWPENAVDGYITLDSPIAQRLSDSARVWNTSMVIGTGFIKTYPKDTEELYRGFYRQQPYNLFNAALFVEANGGMSVYEKANLVPVVERLPFVDHLEAVDVGDWVDWGSISGFGKGTKANMLNAGSYRTPGLICYDSVYPSWIRKFVQNEASFLTIITNDGWWGDTSGHHQHFAYARLRAIEFDRWIARSANNGISGIIAPNGKVIHKTDFWVRTGFTGTIENRTTQTLYTRFGNWFPMLCLIITLGGFLYLRFYTPGDQD